MIKLHKLKAAFLASILFEMMGCTYKGIEHPGAIPGGYYNGYFNSNAIILYKRPSSKFGCWLTPAGYWECIRR
jgi:hypothetical protein